MDYTYKSLTPQQSYYCKVQYAQLMRLSKERRAFALHCRETGWDGHIGPLWDAYLKSKGLA